jgi:protoporphyrinogen/coproporphyrinogen III oxidase
LDASLTCIIGWQVSELDLADQLMSSPKGEESVAGFIYYPDHLVGIPNVTLNPFKDPLGTLASLAKLAATMAEPVFRDILPSILNIFRTKNSQYQKDMFMGRTDMSVGDYYAYRFGRPGLVDKVMSAMVHGITGGDVWKQSMGSGFFADQLVPVEDQPITNVMVRTADLKMMMQVVSDQSVYDLASEHLKSSALWFRDGFSTLPNALAEALERNPNVTIKTRDPAVALSYNSELDKVDVSNTYSPITPPLPMIITNPPH